MNWDLIGLNPQQACLSWIYCLTVKQQDCFFAEIMGVFPSPYE